MKVALVNPPWSFEHSIYFGCREPHLPLELGYARAMLRAAGHQADIIDAQLHGLDLKDVAAAVKGADMTVVTTAPSYLFWRCAPPELRVPQETFAALDGIGGLKVVIGPHASTTPRAVMEKLPADIGVMGESEETLVAIASGATNIPGTIVRRDGHLSVHGGPRAAAFVDHPPLHWDNETIARHSHHHHRFEAPPRGPGAEVEASRGCPFNCTFCAKENYRDAYRKRAPEAVLEEVSRLKAQGTEYVYFIDEIFLPNAPLLEGLKTIGIKFGIQTRIDLWKPDAITLLGEAGCVSAECGVESLTREGREALDKRCKLTTDELRDRLILARHHIPFVQANLIETPLDDEALVEDWRNALRDEGVWANDPVPLFPYPGSPDYRRLWGLPDNQAWERAVGWYLDRYGSFSDIQDQRPLPLNALEHAPCATC
jgi:B12-binding domain/radical SAM domain protein of rhizo-twelve system